MPDQSNADRPVMNGAPSGHRHASALPEDAVAVIRYDGRPHPRGGWVLSFKARHPLRIEPLMGWSESTDPLPEVVMRFPAAESAIHYCQDEGLAFEIEGGPATPAPGQAQDPGRAPGSAGRPSHPLRRLDADEADRLYLCPGAIYPDPDAVLADDALTADQKRAILRSWEWDEYLLEVASAEGPVREHASRLAEVRAALARLDDREEPDADYYRWVAPPDPAPATTGG